MTQFDTTQTLQPYTIRRSARAKRISIKIHPNDGLVLVVPRRSSVKYAEQFLREQHAWINKHRDKINAIEARKLKQKSIELPNTIRLQSIRSDFKIIYDFDPSYCAYSVQFRHGSVRIIGPKHSEKACVIGLKKWLRLMGNRYLKDRLAYWSEVLSLTYGRCTIRSQKTRWGSCSESGNISLNDRLMFFPEDTVDYVLIHELCHLVHMDHSEAFWEYLESHCPNHQNSRLSLYSPEEYIPACFF